MYPQFSKQRNDHYWVSLTWGQHLIRLITLFFWIAFDTDGPVLEWISVSIDLMDILVDISHGLFLLLWKVCFQILLIIPAVEYALIIDFYSGTELREIQKQIDNLQCRTDPVQVGRLLSLRRDVMFQQFDVVISYAVRDTFLSNGNLQAFKVHKYFLFIIVRHCQTGYLIWLQ